MAANNQRAPFSVTQAGDAGRSPTMFPFSQRRMILLPVLAKAACNVGHAVNNRTSPPTSASFAETVICAVAFIIPGASFTC
jgi:hypothetical protein